MNADSKYFEEYYDLILRNVKPANKAKEIAFRIVADIRDRRGLKHEFNNIDSDIQDEIIDKLIAIIKKSPTI